MTESIPTPAADALALAEDGLREEVRRIYDAENARLTGFAKATLVEMAADVVRSPKSMTKADLVDTLARNYSLASGAQQSLSDLRRAADREDALIRAIASAPEAVEKAKADILKAVEAGAWGPERAADAAMAWETAIAALRLWRGVEERAKEVGPSQAVVEVARAAAADVLSTVGSGSGRSTDAVRNAIRDAEMRGVYSFLRVAGRHSQEVSALIRY